MSTCYTSVVSLVLGAVLSAGAARAGQLKVTWVEFPAGNSLVLTETVGAPLKMKADEYLYQKSGQDALVTFEFLFWNKGGSVQTDRTIDDDPGGSDSFATAWYLKTGSGGDCPPNCFVTTWAFSVKENTVIADTPIASVQPNATPALWTTPSTIVSTSTTASKDVTINALDQFGGKYGFVFNSWLVLSGKPPFKPSTSQSFMVPAYTSPYAIAFYDLLPGPPPCVHKPCPPE